jgi:hypothetical protein
MEIINLNKHAVDVLVNGQKVSFPPSGQVATVQVKSIQDGEVSFDEINSIPLFRSEHGSIQGLPNPQDGVLYMVNVLVGTRGALEGRQDLIGPDSGPSAVRYQDGPRKGQIEAVTQFVKF